MTKRRSTGKRQSPQKNRRSGSNPAASFSLFRLAWKLGLVLLLLLAGWTIYLDVQITSQFEDHRWEIPSRVFARPLDLYNGAPVTAEAFRHELEVLGYEPAASTDEPGTFSRNGSDFRVHTQGFRFPDGKEPPRRLALTFEDGVITRFRALNDNAAVARLEPQQIAGIYPGHGEDRVLVQLDDAPPLFRETLLTVEDRNFESHHGIAPSSIARAFLANLKAGRVVQGGSTLTQQLVKNFWLSSKQTYWRKFNEAIMALLLEARYPKDDILEAYINEAYLGQSGSRAIHGFGLGSEFFFDKSFSNLELHETALLVGMVRGPGYYNPRRYPERARERRNLVLRLLQERGLITAARAGELKSRPLGVVPTPSNEMNRYPGFMDLVRKHLGRDYRDEDLESSGLRIFTTMDPQVQAVAEKRMKGMLAALEEGEDPGSLEGAMVITRREGGEVEALVAGRDTRYAGFNRAMNANRPIGSLAKPAVYLSALEKPGDYNLVTPLKDEPLTVEFENGDKWSPSNFSGESHGMVPLHEAFSHSYNQATVRLGLELGLPRVVDTMQRLGLQREPQLYPSLLLGSITMTPMEVTRMYQTIASGGFQVPLRSIRAVTTPDGEVLSRYNLELQQTVDAGPMHLLHYGMQEVMREGTGQSVYNLIPDSLQVAGKTGTTNEGRDSWFAGFTGGHLGVVWIGGDDYSATDLTGSTGALQVWGRTMGDLPQRSFSPVVPEGVRYEWVDGASGALTAENCEGARRIPFIQGSEPEEEVPCSDTMGGQIQRWFQDLF